jgi:hypothetical protein
MKLQLLCQGNKKAFASCFSALIFFNTTALLQKKRDFSAFLISSNDLPWL